ncbi:MAG: hypothetical protein F2667_06280 [Actinobacteria bacterium]|uniref:Unannotated protein n=1 Tax=freshwater metagenome TaxID=449393 RepID=A0A6J6QE91_9ZZZZ|nr:hypothetical protein [Actinomycetota bacterium]
MRPISCATVRLRLERSAPAVLRLRWYVDGVLVGEKRAHESTTLIRVPLERDEHTTCTIEIHDDRDVADRRRLMTTRTVVALRGGWTVEATAELARGASISGTVARADGLARFATVRAESADGVSVETRTDGRGEFTLAGLPAGPLVVSAAGRRLVSTPQVVPTVAGRPTWCTFVLSEPAPDPAPAPMRVGGALRGTVVDRDGGEPEWAAIVEVRDSRGLLLARTRTDRNGTFVVGGSLARSAGLTLVVRSGPGRIAVDTAVRRGVSVGEGQLADVGTVRLPRTPRRAPLLPLHPRASTAAMRLPATRV